MLECAWTFVRVTSFISASLFKDFMVSMTVFDFVSSLLRACRLLCESEKIVILFSAVLLFDRCVSEA